MPKCEFGECGREFQSNQELQRHAKSAHRQELVPCFEVSCNGKLFEDIQRHHRNHHSGGKTCSFCQKNLASFHYLSEHIKKYHRALIGLVEPPVPIAPGVDKPALLDKLNQLEPNVPHKKLIPKEHYVINYDAEEHHPVWVFEHLDRSMISDQFEREETDFEPETELEYKQLQPAAIAWVKMVKGHLAPAGNYRFTLEALKSTFSMANCIPMEDAVNSGSWNALEKFVRELNSYWTEVSVFEGPTYNPAVPKRDAAGGIPVPIPEFIFKVLELQRPGEQPQHQAYLVPNKDDRTSTNFFQHRTTMEEVHRLSGLRFFPDSEIRMTWDVNAEVQQYHCQYCYMTYLEEDLLKQHLLIHRPDNRCYRCHKTFPTPDALRTHMDTVHKVHVCPECQKVFVEERLLENHMRTHTNEKPFQCPQCPQAFSVKANLDSHVRAHNNERRFQCPHCDQAFVLKTNLDTHMRVHTGERPFQCPDCPKSFKQKDHLTKHSVVHTGARPFPCPYCAHATTRKCHLDSHVSSQHPERLEEYQVTHPPKRRPLARNRNR